MKSPAGECGAKQMLGGAENSPGVRPASRAAARAHVIPDDKAILIEVYAVHRLVGRWQGPATIAQWPCGGTHEGPSHRRPVPDAPGRELQALADDIKENGLHDGSLVDEGEIIDGRTAGARARSLA